MQRYTFLLKDVHIDKENIIFYSFFQIYTNKMEIRYYCSTREILLAGTSIYRYT